MLRSATVEMTQVLVFARDVANAREFKAGLENANYGVRIVCDEAKALDVVDNMAPAAVLVLAAGEARDPLRFAEQLADEAAPRPALVLIVNRADRDRAEAIADETLLAPARATDVVSGVRTAIARRILAQLGGGATADCRADTAHLALGDYLRGVAEGQASVRVDIRYQDQTAWLSFHRGEVFDAKLRHLRAEEALFRTLTWPEAIFELSPLGKAPSRTFQTSLEDALAQGFRHVAQFKRLLAELPTGERILVVDGAELLARMNEIPDEINGVIRLFNGKRTIFDVLDESPFDDCSTLAAVGQLCREGLLSGAVASRQTSGLLADLPAEGGRGEDAPPSDDDDVGRGRADSDSMDPVDPAEIDAILPEAPVDRPSRNSGLFDRESLHEMEAYSDEPLSDAPYSDEPSSDGPYSDEPSSDGPYSDEPSSDGRYSDDAGRGRMAANADEEPFSGLPRDEATGLSSSGVSDHFFGSMPPEEPVFEEDDYDPLSGRPVYLSDEQLARKKRNMKVVGVVVGTLAAVLLFVVLTKKLPSESKGTPVLPTATVTSAMPTATTQATAVATAVPTIEASAASATAPSAAPSASATAAEDDGAEELPQVDDPRKEAMALLNRGRCKQAILMGKAAIKKEPENADAYFALGMAYECVFKPKEAKKVYDSCASTATKGQYLRTGYCKARKR